jgi:hypothetical protein
MQYKQQHTADNRKEKAAGCIMALPFKLINMQHTKLEAHGG